MKFKKVLSVFLAVIFIFSAFSTVNAFAAEDRNVIASGICGAEGDNLKWTLYDDGELVISGEGEMDWYYPNSSFNKYSPWYENREKIKMVTIEEGVTSIGEDAFCGCTYLHRINLPVSLEFYQGNFVNTTRNSLPYGAHLALCYPGNSESWDKVVKKTVNWLTDKETGEVNVVIRSIEEAEVTSLKPVFKGVFSDAKLYLNGEEPQIFCEITGDDNLKTIYFDDDVKLRAKYYFAGREDLKLQWKTELISGNFSCEQNKAGVNFAFEMSCVDYANGTVNLSVVTEDGNVIASDKSKTLKTSQVVLEELEPEVTPIEKFFAPVIAIFSELLFAFGFGLNIFVAILAMPFYALIDLFK